MIPFWYGWDSWPTELLSGGGFTVPLALAIDVVALWLHDGSPSVPSLRLVFLTTLGLTLFYELVLDRNPDGKLRDLGQREVGILAGIGFYALLLTFRGIP